jgi:hypothetical protein
MAEGSEGSAVAAEHVMAATVAEEAEKDKGNRREIKGGIPYSTSPGVLKKALESIIPAERPDKFGADYMTTILRLTGGGARTTSISKENAVHWNRWHTNFALFKVQD